VSWKKPEVLHDLLQFFFALLGRSDWSSPIALDTGDSLAPTVPMVPGTLMQLPGNVYGPARAAHYEVSESAAGRHEQVMCSSFADCGTLTMCSSPPAKRGFLDLNKGATPPPSPLCLLCQLWTRTPYRELRMQWGECEKECQNRCQIECQKNPKKMSECMLCIKNVRKRVRMNVGETEC